MSTFLVKSQTIHELVTACVGYGLVDIGAVDAVVFDLMRENVASVSYRYADPLPPFTEWAHLPTPATAGQVAKSLDCYLYNSCEHPAWETSQARALCLRLAVAMLDHVPGYQESEWR